MMKISEAIAVAGPLGYPSKMPGTAYGISAKACIIGAKLAKIPGSVCLGCYALKANYLYPSRRAGARQATRRLANPALDRGHGHTANQCARKRQAAAMVRLQAGGTVGTTRAICSPWNT